MKTCFESFCIVLLSALAGCASLEAHDHARMLETAVQDDRTCLEQGWRYPDPVYITCRMQLQDDRLHKDWLNLQLMRQSQAQPNAIPAPYTPREYYRPLDRDHFDCRLYNENKLDYILCDEDDNSKKP